MKKEKQLDRTKYNSCRYCNRILMGISACECNEKMENVKLWSRPPRNSNKSRKDKL